MHSGIDIAADPGTEIRAAYSGIVSEVGSNSVGGNYISVVHRDGSETLYCHCSEIIATLSVPVRLSRLSAAPAEARGRIFILRLLLTAKQKIRYYICRTKTVRYEASHTGSARYN